MTPLQLFLFVSIPLAIVGVVGVILITRHIPRDLREFEKRQAEVRSRIERDRVRMTK